MAYRRSGGRTSALPNRLNQVAGVLVHVQWGRIEDATDHDRKESLGRECVRHLVVAQGNRWKVLESIFDLVQRHFLSGSFIFVSGEQAGTLRGVFRFDVFS